MVDLNAQAQKQLANIEADTGLTAADFRAAVDAEQLEKHGKIVAFLKKTYNLGHGNANLLAHLIIRDRSGGPPPAEALLEKQFSGRKAHLRATYDELVAIATALGDDVAVVIQKTAVSFRTERKQFANVKAASGKRLVLGLNLPQTPTGGRVVAVKGGMCSHSLDLTSVEDLDDAVASWLSDAYDHCR